MHDYLPQRVGRWLSAAAAFEDDGHNGDDGGCRREGTCCTDLGHNSATCPGRKCHQAGGGKGNNEVELAHIDSCWTNEIGYRRRRSMMIAAIAATRLTAAKVPVEPISGTAGIP